jgi:hypothetical protein
MSDANSRIQREDLGATGSATETHREPHGAAAPDGSVDDVPEHEMDDAHGHAGDDEPLGPIDVPAWTAAAVGVALGLVIVASLVAANGGFGG